jgi:hydroxymethylpyrimidine pyrophosphatase-like HAD family hydrolase
VAVANAIPRLKERVHLVTAGVSGTGVSEVLHKLIATGNLP